MGDKLTEYLKKEGEKWHATFNLSGRNNTAYGALKQSVKNTLLTQQVRALPKSYTKTANIVDQCVDPKTGKHVFVSMQPGVDFMQTYQPPPNNR